jgi:hypothetical protein
LSDWPDGKHLNLESYAQQEFILSPHWLFLLKTTAKLGLKLPMRSHCYGMVGFIKQLIDEQAAQNVTKRNADRKTKKEIKI